MPDYMTSKLKESLFAFSFLPEVGGINCISNMTCDTVSQFYVIIIIHPTLFGFAFINPIKRGQIGNQERRKARDSIRNFRKKSTGCFHNIHWNIKGNPQTKENERKSIQKE